MTSRYLIDIETRKSKIIHVYRNGDKYSRAALVLLRPIEQQQIERIFRAIEEKLRLEYNKPIRKIYTIKGKEIDDPIFVKDQNYYVVGSSENFINVRYGCIYKWTMIGPVKWSKFAGVFYEPPEQDELLIQQKAMYHWRGNYATSARLPSKMTKSMSAYPSDRKVKSNSKIIMNTNKRPVSEPSNDTKIANKKMSSANGYLQSPDEKHSSGDASETSPKIVTNQNKRSMDQFLNDSLKMYQMKDKVNTNGEEINRRDDSGENKLENHENDENDETDCLTNIDENITENGRQIENKEILEHPENLNSSEDFKTEEIICDKSEEDDLSNLHKNNETAEYEDDKENDEYDKKDYLHAHLDVLKPYSSADNLNCEDRNWKTNESMETRSNVDTNRDEFNESESEDVRGKNKEDEAKDIREISEEEETGKISNLNKDLNQDDQKSEPLENEDQVDTVDQDDIHSEIGHDPTNENDEYKEDRSESPNMVIEAEENEENEPEDTNKSIASDNEEDHSIKQIDLKDDFHDKLLADENLSETRKYDENESEKGDESYSDVVQDSLKVVKDSEIDIDKEKSHESEISEDGEELEEKRNSNELDVNQSDAEEIQAKEEENNSNSEEEDDPISEDKDKKRISQFGGVIENQIVEEVEEDLNTSSSDIKDKVEDNNEDDAKVDSHDLDKEESDDETESMIDTGRDELKFKEKEIIDEKDEEDDDESDLQISDNNHLPKEDANIPDHIIEENNFKNTEKSEEEEEEDGEEDQEENEEDKDNDVEQLKDEGKEQGISHDNEISMPDSETGNTEDQNSEINMKKENDNVNEESISESSMRGIKQIKDESNSGSRDQYNRIDIKVDEPENCINAERKPSFVIPDDNDQEINNKHLNDTIQSKSQENDEEQAAKIIQKNYRGHLVRKELTNASKDLDNDESEGEQHRSYDVHDSDDDENDQEVNFSYSKDGTNDLVTNEIMDENSQIDSNYPDDIFSLNNKP